MFRAVAWSLIVAAVFTTDAGTAQRGSVALLPVDREAARVQTLQDAFEHHTSKDVVRDYGELKDIVQEFVIRQLNAAPAISDDALRDQLQRMVSRRWTDTPDGGLFVKSASPWGPRSKERVWAVAYVVWLGTHGPGGTGAVIDGYVWEPGGARLVGRQDADFSGYSLESDSLESGPGQVAFLSYGGLSGSNGLGSWKAIVYVSDRKGVRAIWRSPVVAGLTAVARDDLIALRYARPCDNAASSACAWTYELYAFDNSSSETASVNLVSRTTR